MILYCVSNWQHKSVRFTCWVCRIFTPLTLYSLPSPNQPYTSSKYKEEKLMAEGGQGNTQSHDMTPHDQHPQYSGEIRPELVPFPDFYWDGTPIPTSSKYKEGEPMAEGGEVSTQSQDKTPHQKHPQYFWDSRPELVPFPDFYWDGTPIPGKHSYTHHKKIIIFLMYYYYGA